MDEGFLEVQKILCASQKSEFVEVKGDHNTGVSRNISSEVWPINGLRHGRTRDTTGWYIWRGEFSEDLNFFKPICTEHLMQNLPNISKYLGLAPGWRFQLAPGYEDIWFDKDLLVI